MARTELWNYPGNLQQEKGSWEGYDVEATDGSLGEVDEMTRAAGKSCLVVNTGKIFGKKRMIPAGSVRGVDHQRRKVAVSLTKDQIKKAPEFDADRRNDEQFYESHDRYYGDYLG
jgi:hypothetical protein